MADIEKAKALLTEMEKLLAERYNLYRFEGPVMDLIDATRRALDAEVEETEEKPAPRRRR